MSEPLKAQPRIHDFQTYMDRVTRERGFADETVPDLFMLLLEECGEFARAARKHTTIKMTANKQLTSVADEAADVFIYLLTICNHLGIDLEQAFRDKEETNNKRTWV